MVMVYVHPVDYCDATYVHYLLLTINPCDINYVNDIRYVLPLKYGETRGIKDCYNFVHTYSCYCCNLAKLTFWWKQNTTFHTDHSRVLDYLYDSLLHGDPNFDVL